MPARPPSLGVCYFPEHWPREMWAGDIARMVDLGLKHVRIGEFSWAVSEPEPGLFDWDWLDRVLDLLGEAGLEVMLCTPTATPPKWLIDAHPDILAWDAQGRPRRFGSRRHYCFSSRTYRAETARIVEAIASRYGQHKAVTGWQTDNEYGCHNTTRSYSPEAARAFRLWLAERYGEIGALNAAWGNVFWSQTYRSFDEVDLPNLTVTEPNPSHVLDFCRFSSDQVVSYNKLQVDILRRLSPGREIAHNFMGAYFEFDHFKLGADLDIASWDSYPLGFLDVLPFDRETKDSYLRQGHPDFQGFHHDLYRACGRGRLQIMEQQPGPVNWARHNPAPLPGMVSLWSLEAVAHGADVVRYFRWRQAPFAQEQMHAGLERPDAKPAPASAEARDTARLLEEHLPDTPQSSAKIALVFSYEAHWLFETQPQGAGWDYFAICLDWYGAVRALGLDVDIVPPGADLSAYSLVLVPSLPIVDDAALAAFQATKAQLVFGPRSFSKTPSCTIPDGLPPGPLRSLIPLTITRSESLPAFAAQPEYGVWIDHVEMQLKPSITASDGTPVLFLRDKVAMFTALPTRKTLNAALTAHFLPDAGIEDWEELPAGLRVRRSGDLVFGFNYSREHVSLPFLTARPGAEFLFGHPILEPAGTACWRNSPIDAK